MYGIPCRALFYRKPCGKPLAHPAAQPHHSGIQLLEILLSGLVLIGLLFSAVPLIKWMPGLLFYGNEVEIRIFLERSLDIVIGIEFIKCWPSTARQQSGSAALRHCPSSGSGHDSAVENLLSVGAVALIFIVRKFFFVPASVPTCRTATRHRIFLQSRAASRQRSLSPV